jgi:NAD(P)-dependent dehydrogenase (short-subunit alcohol dehydrogenase family)
MRRLEGKVALISGAGRGIGKAAATRFCEEGANVVIVEYDEEAGLSAKEELSAKGYGAAFVFADGRKADSVADAVQYAVRTFGRLNILYNNIGGTSYGDGPVAEAEDSAFYGAIEKDLRTTWLFSKYAIPAIIKGGGGAVLNSSSGVALVGKPRGSASDCYTATKGAIAALTRSMAVNYASDNVRVNALAPGVTLTERVSEFIERGHIPQSMLDRHLLGLCQPIDVANAALFLVSDEARMITGHVLPVDSGWTIS